MQNGFQILTGDSLEVVPTLEAESFDACVCDPPYELGFMGKAWDKSGIAYNADLWRAVYRVLKPGAYLLAFGGSRTYHRLACAIEDAGFEIRDQIQWIYGSGFPKSLNVGDGRGTALKPAHEPIAMARKPLEKGLTVAQNVLKWGTGAINVDRCRVPITDSNSGDVGRKITRNILNRDGWGMNSENAQQGVEVISANGRFPANVIHDGSYEVIAAFPETASGQPCGIKTGGQGNAYGAFAGGIPVTGYGDEGSAARFFYSAKASKYDRNAGLEAFDIKQGTTSGMTTRGERERGETRKESMGAANHHPTVKPTDLMQYLCRLVTPPGGLIIDPFLGSGSTMKAALIERFRCVGIELNAEYAEIAKARLNSLQVKLF